MTENVNVIGIITYGPRFNSRVLMIVICYVLIWCADKFDVPECVALTCLKLVVFGREKWHQKDVFSKLSCTPTF